MRLLLLLLPWLELATLIQLGIEVGALGALFYVFATLVLGFVILQRQGLGMFQHLREAQMGRVLGARLLLDDMAVGLAGVLLMIPGILSDIAALLVLFGPLRRKLARWLGGPQAEAYAPGRDEQASTTIEGSYRRVDD